MKHIIFLIFGFVFSVFLDAQSSQTSFQTSSWPVVFDNYWKEAQVPNAPVYYRDFKPFTGNRSGGVIRDYYASGKVQMDGTTNSNMLPSKPNDFIKDGLFTWYYENGKISGISFYRNDKLDGLKSTFSEEGELLDEGNYKADKMHGEYKSYHKGGKPWFVANYNNGVLVNNFATEYSESGERYGVYVENFVTAANPYNWQLGEFATYSAKIEPMVGLKLTDEDSQRMGFHLSRPLVLTGTMFFLGARISSISGLNGSYYGLTFDFKDWDNYKYFLISDNGNYAVGQYIQGTRSYIVSPNPSNAIKKRQEIGGYYYDNVNELQIETSNGKTTFTINQKVVYSAASLMSGTGMVGLYIESGKKSVTFNQFIIKAK